MLSKKELVSLQRIRQIHVDLTKKCNYQCEYCCAYAGLDKNHLYQHMDDKTIENLKCLFKKIPGNSTICFLGGEPTLHPKFQEVGTTALESGHSLTVITNFSLSNKYFYRLIDISQAQGRLLLSLSLHLSQISSPEDFLKKVFELKNYAQEKTTIWVTAVVTDDNYHILKSIEKKLALKNIPLLFNYMRTKDNIPVIYTNKDINSSIQWLDFAGKNNYLVKCNAGFHYVYITERGNVFRCQNYMFDGSSLGNINKKINLNKQAELCFAQRCICNANQAPSFF